MPYILPRLGAMLGHGEPLQVISVIRAACAKGLGVIDLPAGARSAPAACGWAWVRPHEG